MHVNPYAQFAKANGANVVATTSSARKAEALVRIGVDYIINYHETPEWGRKAFELTGRNEGFDNIIEIGGAGTLEESMKAVKKEGTITLIGGVTGFGTDINVLDAILKIFTFRGIHVGSKVQFEEMMAAIQSNKIQPVIDEKIFKFEELKDALQYFVSFALESH